MDEQPANQASEGQDAAVERSLYAKREKIYAREVHGVYARLRVLAVLVLLGAYYGVPWLTWGGRQAVLLDLPNRQFHLFGITFWPQDFFYLAALLIIAALSLFFFTALAGRLWCGYACPQTVWTEVFMWIERKIEGDRPRQMKLDKMPLSARKIAIKGGKHAVWILFSLYTGFTFVGYFTPTHDLAAKVATLSLGPWETFWIIFYGFATYGNAGWMREQVCIYMCPYARFQSAMFDRDTLIISYDEERGDPRGGRKRSVDPAEAGLGDCIDCTLCVQVCPTGIDIRDGLQFECIGCAACIDVCDEVMDKMGYPKGLVRYTTEHAVHGEKTHVVRPRMFVYAALLAVLVGALIFSIAGRVPLEVDVIRDRIALYRETHEGLIENTYNIKVVNKDQSRHQYRLSASGIEGLELINTMGEFTVEPGRVLEVPVRLRIDPVNIDRASSKVDFEVFALDNPEIAHVEPARFLGPVLK
ncbi:MAG: cytochrome c oxidase accessory protein CcoG [Pseudomonadota bacterium]|nr:cytochrome c oxidase accessory protein CcoG [Pseudomonadota bacterium]